ncbi:MAG: tetratricopeptide repeat protein [Myxococcales bacterium]
MRAAIVVGALVSAQLVLTGCATAPAPKADAPAGPVADPRAAEDEKIAETLRQITATVRRGQGDKLRAGLLIESQQRPKDPRLRLQLAWMRAPSDDAWQELKALVRLDMTDPWPYWGMGAIYLQWPNFSEQAAGEFAKALSLRKGFVPALIGQADVLRVQKKYPEAIAAYETVLKSAPNWPEALRGLGLARLASGDVEGGRRALERALEAFPDDFESLTQLARLALEQKDADAAIRHHTRLLQFSPRDRAVRLQLAKLKQERGDVPGAAAEYEAALAIGVDAALLEELVALYRSLNQPSKEADALERLAAFRSEDPAPLLRLAELRNQEGDPDAAEAALRQASERVPDDAALLLQIARIIRDRDDLIAAINAFRLAKAKGAKANDDLNVLYARAMLDPTPVSGDVNRIYRDVFKRLNRVFEARKKDSPSLAGRIRVRVSVAADGEVTDVEILEDTVHEPAVLANVYFNLRDARFPKEKRSPTFEFILGQQ